MTVGGLASIIFLLSVHVLIDPIAPQNSLHLFDMALNSVSFLLCRTIIFR